MIPFWSDCCVRNRLPYSHTASSSMVHTECVSVYASICMERDRHDLCRAGVGRHVHTEQATVHSPRVGGITALPEGSGDKLDRSLLTHPTAKRGPHCLNWQAQPKLFHLEQFHPLEQVCLEMVVFL